MTHKELVDYCNSMHGDCDSGMCDYHITKMCDEFNRLHGTTPYLENERNNRRYYTDDELFFTSSNIVQSPDDIDDSVTMSDLLI